MSVKEIWLNFQTRRIKAVDWLKCIIYQKKTKEETQCPANSKRHDLGAKPHY